MAEDLYKKLEEQRLFGEELQRNFNELKQKVDKLEKPIEEADQFKDVEHDAIRIIDVLHAGLPVLTSAPTYTGFEGEMVWVNDGTHYYLYAYINSGWRDIGTTDLTDGNTTTLHDHDYDYYVTEDVDSYSEANQDTTYNIYSGFITTFGQSFAVPAGLDVDIYKCKFYLKKDGSPTGNAVAKLYAHSGTYGSSSVPTGDPLATSSNFDVSTLTTSFQLISFQFTTPYTATAGEKYCVIFEYDGGDASNHLIIGVDETDNTHAGNGIYSGAARAYDTIFYVYGLLTI